MNVVPYWSLVMNRIARVLYDSLRLLAATAALCFVAAMPVSLDLATKTLSACC